MFRSKKTGFTLIELLVVMAILSVSLSLVAPFTMQSVESFQVRSELSELEQLFRSVQANAYYAGGEIQIELLDNLAIVNNRNGTQTQVEFKFLYFPHQEVSVPALMLGREIQVYVVVREEQRLITVVS